MLPQHCCEREEIELNHWISRIYWNAMHRRKFANFVFFICLFDRSRNQYYYYPGRWGSNALLLLMLSVKKWKYSDEFQPRPNSNEKYYSYWFIACLKVNWFSVVIHNGFRIIWTFEKVLESDGSPYGFLDNIWVT